MALSPTPNQLRFLRFVRGFQIAKGHSPSYREIGEAICCGSRGKAHALAMQLEERGLIRTMPQRARSIELLVPVAIPHAPDGAPLHFVSLGEMA